MKELFNVTPHDGGDGFLMNMTTGSIDVPDNPGCYVVSSGCGSGKTESIKSLIRQKYNAGILYCVDTKAELQKMYSWILANLCGINPDLTENDIVILSSAPSFEEELNAYRDNPGILMTKKIVLLTHVRFWTDLINYFLVYRPTLPVDAFDGDFTKLMSRTDLRRYVIFDETPSFVKPFFKVSKTILGCFSEQGQDGSWILRDKEYMESVYKEFIEGTGNDPFPNKGFEIGKIKRQVIMSMIPKLYPQWLASRDEDMTITFTPAMLKTDTTNTHVLVFEGAGDILFSGSRNYQLLDIKSKYNSTVDFIPFDFHLKRRGAVPSRDEFHTFITSLVQTITMTASAGHKTLVVTWMNQGQTSASGDTGFVDMVKQSLGRYKTIRGCYAVTYYGNSDTKSTNDYRDYQCIILAGIWGLPNTETSKFRCWYGVDTSSNAHNLWYFSQLLSRIGIRKHDGKRYTVYYSNDYSLNFINQLNQYFNSNKLVRSTSDVAKYPDWLDVIVRRVKMKRGCIISLIRLIQGYDEKIGDAIREGRSYSFGISVTDLMKVTERKSNKRREYEFLKKELVKVGIVMNIT